MNNGLGEGMRGSGGARRACKDRGTRRCFWHGHPLKIEEPGTVSVMATLWSGALRVQHHRKDNIFCFCFKSLFISLLFKPLCVVLNILLLATELEPVNLQRF